MKGSDKGKERPTKLGASSRRANAKDNPPKKRARKRAAESQPNAIASTTLPESQPADSAQAEAAGDVDPT
jgi:hypothetical protein